MRQVSYGVAGLAILVAGVAAYPATSAAATVPRATILSVTASPAQLPAGGGTIVIAAHVRNAQTCVFRGQHGPFTSLTPSPSMSCSSGRASVTLQLASNTHLSAATLHFYIRVRDTRGRAVQATLTVVEAAAAAPKAAPQPPVPAPGGVLAVATTSLPNAIKTLPYSTTVAASGGTAPYMWSLAAGALPPGLALSAEGALSGIPTAPGTTAFTLEVTDATGATASATLALEVDASRTTVEKSDNWSGYYTTGGPFTSVTGTFNVPSLTPSTRSADAAEWVGVDGAIDGDSSLIQAGIEERYDRSAKTVRVFAWWEILPAAETLAPLTVLPGDEITVTIAEVSAGLWAIALSDTTSGASYTTEQSFDGPGTSAEWIVEAPTSLGTGSVIRLAHYAPNVTFTGLGVAGAESTLAAVEMVQGGVVTSVPSQFSANGFAVAYGHTAPSPP